MKTCAPIIALSLGACVPGQPDAQPAVDDRTRQDLGNYVAENWEFFAQRLQGSEPVAAGKLEFVDVADVRCEPNGDTFVCHFTVTARTEAGKLATSSEWGTFAYHGGALGEVFVFG